MEKFRAEGLDKYDNIKVFGYIYNMPELMAASDVVISRSGASTMSELSAIGRPSILIPSPNVTNNQQYKNAKIFADRDAAVLIENDKACKESLVEAVDSLFGDPIKLADMSKMAFSLSVHDIEGKIYNCIKSTVTG